MTTSSAQHFHIEVKQSGLTAIDHLAIQSGLSKQQLKMCFDKGAVWWRSTAGRSGKTTQNTAKPTRLRRVKKVLAVGDSLDFYYHPELLNQTPPSAQLVADLGSYSIWLKPRGMLSQGSKWGDFSALYRWVEMHYKPNNQTRQAWIVHRLDRATAGLMLLAHSKSMAQTLSQKFETHQIEKNYQAIVWGEFPHEPQTVAAPIDDKPAVSHISRLHYDASRNLSQVRIQIDTGRKHQIRKHLSQFGFPLVGDRLYGDALRDAALFGAQRPDLQLTAYELKFICPISHSAVHYQLDTPQLNLMTLRF